MVSPAGALGALCGRCAKAKEAQVMHSARALRALCAIASNGGIPPAKALRSLCGGTRRKPPGSPEPASPCGIGRHVFRLPQPTGCAPANRAGRTRPGIRRPTCRDRCRKTSVLRPASLRQARRLPSPCRKGSRPGGSRRPTPTGSVKSGCLPAPSAGLFSWSSGVARTRRIT